MKEIRGGKMKSGFLTEEIEVTILESLPNVTESFAGEDTTFISKLAFGEYKVDILKSVSDGWNDFKKRVKEFWIYTIYQTICVKDLCIRPQYTGFSWFGSQPV